MMALPLVAGALAGGAACVAYGLTEARRYRVREHTLEVLPPGHEPIRILQVSDTHMRRSGEKLAEFVTSLGGETYDLVLATGDLLGEPDAVDICSRCLNSLNARYGRYFVLGASDYYAPKFKNYLDYFLGRRNIGTQRNPVGQLRKALDSEGWVELTNQTLNRDLGGMSLQITGLDDPYLHRDDRSLLEVREDVDLAMLVVHDPAPALQASKAGFDLVVSGHTHGGQVRFPFVGAVVTNSDIPRKMARWATRLNGTQLFVSPGLGTGPYAPFRFLCPPEASVLRLVPRA
jgi:predicted MPP superfamily phosphohydrolase